MKNPVVNSELKCGRWVPSMPIPLPLLERLAAKVRARYLALVVHLKLCVRR